MSFPAPADVDEAEQLSELYRVASDLLSHWQPSQVVLCRYEVPNADKNLTTVQRAEGAVLSAVGKQALGVTSVGRHALLKAAGLGPKGKTQDALNALCANVAPDLKALELQRAVAAACCG